MNAARAGNLTLILGGARSGKSRYAERLVLASGLTPVYVATAQALDAEMAARIAQHRARRGASWRTIEEPIDLVGVLLRECRPGPGRPGGLSHSMADQPDGGAAAGAGGQRAPARAAPEPGRVMLVLVSNEVGLGVVPTDAMARAFIEHAGWLHQRIAEQADVVVFMAAGLPLHLKSPTDR